MRNVSPILLTVLLAAALILELLLYDLYRDTNQALLLSQEKVVQLNERVSQLSAELREAAQRPDELEREITQKDRILSECEGTKRTCQKDLLMERQINAHLSSEIASKDASLNELWENLKEGQSRIRFLEEENQRLKALQEK